MAEISIISDEKCELGEGPYFCQTRNTLFWFDIVAKKQHSYHFKTANFSAKILPEMTSAMSVTQDNADVFFTETGLWLQAPDNDAPTQIVAIEQDNRITRSNDARVHPSGAFWLGTMGKKTEEKAGAIYYYRKGRFEKLFNDITISNAICFSPDGKTSYFTDTVTGKLMRVATDPETGLPDDTPHILIDHTDQKGGIDGAVVDADGNIWVALWGASCLKCFDANGTFVRSVELPTAQPTCPVFVADNKLCVTTAWQNMSDAQKAKDAHAGNTFAVSTPVSARYDYTVLI